MNGTPQLPFINLGCGRVILPAQKPAHHASIPDGIHDYALWNNVDAVASDGVDEVVDLFSYPWKWADNSFDGALASHLVEHIPHEMVWENKYMTTSAYTRLSALGDGFYAFFSELHRVLTPGAFAHIIVPFGFSTGALQDPTHHRYLVRESFQYLVPNPDAPFVLPEGGAWALDYVLTGLTEMATPYQHDPQLLERMVQTQFNICSELYVRLKVIK